MRIGLARALHFYSYGLLWYCFLKELGQQVVLSDLSNQQILEAGARHMVDTACLPLKILNGHIENLKEKKVDYIFLPRIVRESQDTFSCPKAAGLPELITASSSQLPPLLSPVIEGSIASASPYYATGRVLGKSRGQVKKAYEKAYYQWDAMRQREKAKNQNAGPTIAILSHAYLSEDRFVSFQLKEQLQKLGYHVITAPLHALMPQDASIFPHYMFWQSGQNMGALMQGKQTKKERKTKPIAGYIFLSAFGCGPDSYIETYCRKAAEKRGAGYLLLTLDEQTGKAGVMTRLEAFLDVVKRCEKRRGA